jgi:hypothetical protein
MFLENCTGAVESFCTEIAVVSLSITEANKERPSVCLGSKRTSSLRLIELMELMALLGRPEQRKKWKKKLIQQRANVVIDGVR